MKKIQEEEQKRSQISLQTPNKRDPVGIDLITAKSVSMKVDKDSELNTGETTGTIYAKELVSPGQPLSNKSLEDNYMNEEDIIKNYQEKQNEKRQK